MKFKDKRTAFMTSDQSPRFPSEALVDKHDCNDGKKTIENRPVEIALFFFSIFFFLVQLSFICSPTFIALFL